MTVACIFVLLCLRLCICVCVYNPAFGCQTSLQ